MQYSEIVKKLQTEFKVYVPTDLDGATDIKYQLFYSLGGMNYFSGSPERRGYYISITPVTRNGISESFSMFSGGKYFVNNSEVSRKSAKALAEARANITEQLLEELTAQIKHKEQRSNSYA